MPEWSIDELLEQARNPLAGTAARTVEVDALNVRDDTSGDLDCDITVTTQRGRSRWRITIQEAIEHLERASIESAGLIVRSNIEEWWDTGGPEADGPDPFERVDGESSPAR